MLGQRRRWCASIEKMLSVCDCPGIHNNTQLTQADVESMLAQHFVHHLRRWTNVKPTLIQRLVSAGLPIHMYRAYIICLSATPAQQNKHLSDVALMLGELHRRCSSIKPAKKNNLFVVKI